MEYKAQRKSTRTKSSASTDHQYGPNSLQDDISPSELLQLLPGIPPKGSKHRPTSNTTPNVSQRTVCGTISASCDLQLPTSAELQSDIPPDLLATWSSPCCNPSHFPQKQHAEVLSMKITLRSNTWSTCCQVDIPQHLVW